MSFLVSMWFTSQETNYTPVTSFLKNNSDLGDYVFGCFEGELFSLGTVRAGVEKM